MKLKLSYQKEPKHSDLVSCVGWSSSSELYSVGDDHKILKWDFKSGETTQVAPLQKDTYVTQIHWLPVVVGGARKQTSHSELFVLTCTDGRFLLVSSLGQVEKTVEAHKGAVLGALWSHDGNALITNGEDGALKVWSRTGMLRTSLAQSASPIYSTSWSPDSDQVLYTSGKSLVIKPLQTSAKILHWKAHDGIILAVDWSTANNTILSGGEDRKYKVWDSYGRVLHSSFLHDSPIASLSWCPDGELFAVGAFNTLRLCDRTGWSHCLEKPKSGTVLKVAWSSDGTQFAGACGNGQVIFAQVVDRRLEWHNLEAVVAADGVIKVKDVMTDAEENIELHERIINVSLGWNHLVVITPLQGYIYNPRNWTTPVTIDLKSAAMSLLLLANRHFLIADSVVGIQIFSYEGRLVSTVKYPRGAVAALNSHTTSLCVDTVAIRDRKEEKDIHIFDTATGRELRDGQPLHHTVEVVCVALSHAGSSSQRQLAFIDRNHDLFVTLARDTSTTAGARTVCLGGMVGSMAWNTTTNMLAAVDDGKLAVWYHPMVAFTNKDLLPQTVVRQEDSTFTKSPQLVQFIGNFCTLRRDDGALITSSISPFPAILHQHAGSSNWDAATKLCRFVEDPVLWACLVGMATSARDLNTAEIAYAAIGEIDKVHYIAEIKALPSAERRNAELALLSHQPQQAEAIYLQVGLVYRAIQLNIDLFNWERALHLAMKHKTHVDTVLAFREKYLAEVGCQETFKKFVECKGKVKIDWETIRAKIENEEQRI